MNPFAPDRRFLSNDPDYAPFGCAWLRGLTPARLALVELLCLIFAIRQNPDGFLAATFYAEISKTILFTHIQLAASLPMLLFVNYADRHTDRSTGARRITALSLAVAAGAAAYVLCIWLSFRFDEFSTWLFPTLLLGGYFLRALSMGGLLTAVLYFFTRETAIAAALQSTRLAGVALDKQMAEAQLRVLQAQIEPHFLFNTLAHIKRLYLIDAAQGKAMLNNLSTYLCGALPLMRKRDSTVGRELALTQAYLNVLQTRMGERLAVNISVPRELRHAELPPMMLSTLVENAIKHGLSSLPEGGTVEIAAVREGDRLRISVADNGVGFQGFSGSGVGLGNTRARLAALYGADGVLTFAANPVRGVTVGIALPFRDLRADGGAT
jgi:signal transduction histidine kinase